MPKRTWVSAYEHHAFYYLQLPETKTLVVQSATRTPEVALGPVYAGGTCNPPQIQSGGLPYHLNSVFISPRQVILALLSVLLRIFCHNKTGAPDY